MADRSYTNDFGEPYVNEAFVPEWYMSFVQNAHRTDQDVLVDGACKICGGWKPNHMEEEYLHMVERHPDLLVMVRLSV